MQRGLGEAARSWGGSAVLGRQRGLGEAARSWGFPPLALCRGFPHEQLLWFPPETKPDYLEPLWLVGSKTKP